MSAKFKMKLSQYEVKKKSKIKEDKRMSIEKIKRVKDVVLESLEAKNDDDVAKHENDDEILKLGSGLERRNAFEIMLKSSLGGHTPSPKPVRVKRRKLIGLTPKGSGQKSLREWFKNE